MCLMYNQFMGFRERCSCRSGQVRVVLCNKKSPLKVSEKFYKTVCGSTMVYGSECWEDAET